MTKHPSEANLALYAGGELSRWRRWSVERHVAECAACRDAIAQFSALREQTRAMAELPDVDWDSLAAEMRANIRLGLEAGECVAERSSPQHLGFSLRGVAACASLAMLLVVSFLIERPAPRVAELKTDEAAVIETSGSGIQVKEGGRAMMLLNARARTVEYQASGSAMGARYVDSDTGQVTINNVYVQ
jgi:anti-sigma factor RsiW